jgi:hypothetical protein
MRAVETQPLLSSNLYFFAALFRHDASLRRSTKAAVGDRCTEARRAGGGTFSLRFPGRELVSLVLAMRFDFFGLLIIQLRQLIAGAPFSAQ